MAPEVYLVQWTDVVLVGLAVRLPIKPCFRTPNKIISLTWLCFSELGGRACDFSEQGNGAECSACAPPGGFRKEIKLIGSQVLRFRQRVEESTKFVYIYVSFCVE